MLSLLIQLGNDSWPRGLARAVRGAAGRRGVDGRRGAAGRRGVDGRLSLSLDGGSVDHSRSNQTFSISSLPGRTVKCTCHVCEYCY